MPRPTRYYEIEDELAAMVADLELYTYYQLLEVSDDAPGEVILYQYNLRNYEYEQLQKDRYCGPVLHHNLAILRERLDEAQRVLLDPRLRRQYNRGLELGDTRHPEIAAQRPAARRAAPPPDELIEELAGQLTRQLDEKFIHAEEQIVDVVSMGVDEALVDQQTIDLKQQVDVLGVELKVTGDSDPIAAVPIESEYLEQATRQMTAKLYVADNLTLHEETEADDLAATAESVSEASEALRGELYKMGVSEWDAPVELDQAIDAGFIDKLVAGEQRAVTALGVDFDVRSDGEPAQALPVDVDDLTAELEQQLKGSQVAYAAQEVAPGGLQTLARKTIISSEQTPVAPPLTPFVKPAPTAAPAPFEDAILIDDLIVDLPPAVEEPPALARTRQPTGPLPAAQSATSTSPRLLPGPFPTLESVAQAARPPTGPLPAAQAAPQAGARRPTGPLPAQTARRPTGPLPTLDEADDLIILVGEGDAPKK